MKILVACEFSQVVTKAFRDKGHEAYSCDILPTEGNPEWHIQDDIRNVLKSRFAKSLDMMIAHDPCTYQCNSGVRWLYLPDGSRDEKRWQLLRDSCYLTLDILNANIPLIARENPIPHKYALGLIGEKYTQCVQPHWFRGSAERITEVKAYSMAGQGGNKTVGIQNASQ